MSRYIPGSQKHLTLDDCRYIERSLNQGLAFKEIAKYLCKGPITISKEIGAHRHSDWYHKGTFYNASCPACNQNCPDFVRERCGRLDKAPYVCNGCPKVINHCIIAHKYRYDARFADRKFFLKQEKLFLAFLMNRCTKGAIHMDFDRLEKKHYSNAEFPRKSMSAGNRMSDTTSPCTKNCLNALV